MGISIQIHEFIIVLGMRVGIDSSLASIIASSTDPTRLGIQTPHRLFRDFRADKTFATSWSGCRVQV